MSDTPAPALTDFRLGVLDAIAVDDAGVDSHDIARRLDTGVRNASTHANWLVEHGYAKAIPARVTYVLTDEGRQRLWAERGYPGSAE